MSSARISPSIVLIGIMTATPAFAQSGTERPELLPYGWSMGWGHLVFGHVMMLLYWGALVVLILFVVRAVQGSWPAPIASSSDDKAVEILRQRFARGEIDKDEFEARKRSLSA